MSEWATWLRQNFGLLLLFVLALIMMGVLLHMSHDQADQTTVGWAREQTSLVLGGLLGLVTGANIARRSPPDPPSDPAK